MSFPELFQNLDPKVAEALEQALDQLRSEFRRELESTRRQITGEPEATEPESPPLEVRPEEQEAPMPDALDELKHAIARIDSAGSQGEILTALLEGARRFCSRSALLLLRDGSLEVWDVNGFTAAPGAPQEIAFTPDEGSAWATATQGHGAVALSGEQCSPLTADLEVESPTLGLLLPMMLGDRVAALLYGDHLEGDPSPSVSALQLLTFSAGEILETLPVRRRPSTATLKLAPPEAPPAVPEPEAEAPTVEAEAEVPEAVQLEPALEEPPAAEPEIEQAVAEPEIEALEIEAEEPEAVQLEPALEEPPAAEPEEALAEPPPPWEEELEPEPAEMEESAPELELPAEAEEQLPSIEAPEEFPPLQVPAEETLGEMSEPSLGAAEPTEEPTYDFQLDDAPAAEEPTDLEATAPEPAPPFVEEAPPPAAEEPESEAETAAPAREPVEPPPVDLGRGSTMIEPPRDLEGPGWAFSRTPSQSGEEAQHEEARRLARLLVTEIKLYNESQVELGRQQGDLYERLREDIDRSREIFNDRIDERMRADRDYFQEALVRILAGGDADALGE